MKPRLSLTEQVVAFLLGRLIGLTIQCTIFLAMQSARGHPLGIQIATGLPCQHRSWSLFGLRLVHMPPSP